MALICSMQTPKGEDSKLYLALRDEFGVENNVTLADNVYSYVISDKFIAKFGNWRLLHNYDAIKKNEVFEHTSEISAKKNANDLNKKYTAGSAVVVKKDGKWVVDLIKPDPATVSKAVNDQGEPLLMYHYKGINQFTADPNMAGQFKAPKGYTGSIPSPKMGSKMPMFIVVKDDTDGKFGDIIAEGDLIPFTGARVLKDESVIPAAKGMSAHTTKEKVKKDTPLPKADEINAEELIGKTDKQLADEIAKRKAMVIETMGILEKKLAIVVKRKGNKTGDTAIALQREINKMYKLHKNNKDMEALLSFLEFAHTQAEEIETVTLKKVLDEINDPSTTATEKRVALKKLARITEYLSAFNIVEDVYGAIEGQTFNSEVLEGATVDVDFRDVYISTVRSKVKNAKRKYLSAAKEIVTDFLMEYNTDPTLTREAVLEMFTHVHDDIGFMSSKLNSLAEASDQILELIDRVISTQRTKLAFEMSTFKNTTFQKKLKALEKSQKVSVSNHEEFYNFMLERNEKGELTGRYIEPGSKKAKGLSKEQSEFLEMFDAAYKAAQKQLPFGYRRGNNLISILKPGSERARQDVKGVKSGLKAAGKYISEQFKVNVDDTDRVEVISDENNKEHKFIPIHYTAPIAKGKDEAGVPIGDLSLNMGSNLLQFMTMAKNYSSTVKVITELEAAKDLVADRTFTKKKGGRTAVAYGSKKEMTEQGILSNAYSRLEDYYDMVLYGERKADEGKLLGIEALDKAKVLDMLAKYTSLQSLALNLYSGINNLSVGNVMNMIEGAGGQFYSRKDYAKAKKDYYSKHLIGIVKDAAAQFSTNPINLWMESYDVIQDFDEFGKPLDSSLRMHRYASKASFFLQNAGEHMVQTELALAMGNSHRIVDGKIMNFNEWVMSEDKPNTKSSKEEFKKFTAVSDAITVKDGKTWTTEKVSQKEMIEFAERIKGVYQRLHGNYAKKDQAGVHKYALGRLVMLFRKWLKPGWDRRFASDTFNNREAFNQRLGDNIAGNYLITWRFMQQYIADMKTEGVKWSLAADNYNALPEWRKAGMRRTLSEAAFIASTMVLITLIGKLEGDDEDDWMKSMLVYQAHRLKSELSFYVSIGSAKEVLRSPSASLNTVESITNALAASLGPVFSYDDFMKYDVYERGQHKGKTKASVKLWKLVPYSNQIQKALNPYETGKFLQDL